MRATRFAGPCVVALAMTAARAAGLPPYECVQLLRQGRIAGMLGDAAARTAAYEKAAKDYPSEVLPLLALWDLDRDGLLPAEEKARVRALFRQRLASVGTMLPYSALAALVADPSASAEDLADLRGSVTTRLAGNPKDVGLLDALALLQERLGERDEERDTLARIDAVQPTGRVLLRRIFLAQQLDHGEEVVTLSRQFRVKYEDQPMVRISAAQALVSLGRLDEAKKEAEPLLADATTRDWAIQEIYLAAAWSLWDAGRDDQARAAFQTVADLAPSDPGARAALDGLFGSAEQRRVAAAAVQESVETMSAQEAFTRGNDRLMVGDYDAAVYLLLRSAKADPGFEMAWFDLGVAAWHKKDWELSREAFAHAGELKADRAESFHYLGVALRELKRCEEAVPAFRRALELRPDLADSQRLLDDCLLKLGKKAGGK